MSAEWQTLLDHIVGTKQNRTWNSKPEGRRRPRVDDQLKGRCLLDGQISDFFAL